MFLFSSLPSKTFLIASRFVQFQSLCTNPDQKFSQKPFRQKNHKIVDYVKVQGEILYGINPVMMALEAEKREFHHVTVFSTSICGDCAKKLDHFTFTHICAKLSSF